MVFRPKRVRFSRVKKVHKRKTQKKTVKSVKTVKKIVNKILHRNVETKQETLALLSSNPVPGGGLDNTTHGLVKPSIVPPLMQGTAINQRIGDKVKPQSLKIKGYVKSLEYDGTSNNNSRPFYAHVWIVIDKRLRNPFDLSGNSIVNNPSNFKRMGNQPVPFDGSITNAYLPYNTDTYKVLAHRRIKLDSMIPSIAVSQPSGGAVIASVQDSINNGCVYAKAFSITLSGKALPKQFTYDEDFLGAGLNQCTNFNPLMFVALQNMDGSLSDSTQQRYAITANSFLYYEDA